MRIRFDDIAITPALFGITFGFAGLSGAWRLTGQHWATTVADLLAVISAVSAVALGIGWVIQLVRHESNLWAELRDPVLGPSVRSLRSQQCCCRPFCSARSTPSDGRW